jgi:hypothetical protein
MITKSVFTAATLIISMVGASWAASPAQVGTWIGSSKVVTFTGGTNKTVSKQSMQIEIAADDTITVTVGGVLKATGSVSFNSTDLLFAYGTPPGTSDIHITTFNFKNNTMKGSSVGYTQGGMTLINTLEGKYKLKKQ